MKTLSVALMEERGTAHLCAHVHSKVRLASRIGQAGLDKCVRCTLFLNGDWNHGLSIEVDIKKECVRLRLSKQRGSAHPEFLNRRSNPNIRDDIWEMLKWLGTPWEYPYRRDPYGGCEADGGQSRLALGLERSPLEERLGHVKSACLV